MGRFGQVLRLPARPVRPLCPSFLADGATSALRPNCAFYGRDPLGPLNRRLWPFASRQLPTLVRDRGSRKCAFAGPIPALLAGPKMSGSDAPALLAVGVQYAPCPLKRPAWIVTTCGPPTGRRRGQPVSLEAAHERRGRVETALSANGRNRRHCGRAMPGRHDRTPPKARTPRSLDVSSLRADCGHPKPTPRATAMRQEQAFEKSCERVGSSRSQPYRRAARHRAPVSGRFRIPARGRPCIGSVWRRVRDPAYPVGNRRVATGQQGVAAHRGVVQDDGLANRRIRVDHESVNSKER